ncbi:hypothetical protein RHMOL_Rhmol10G0308000 [Rhododendron molle]|uniref:Uncharacterized protein n=1 Tax=Rhododendron molle TaxID=49168 RepID=A0ACC0M9L2_RHOML|nr:hypothetical protein RHMOL_Rhmol10G0308000 [Rhododendron molle]
MAVHSGSFLPNNHTHPRIQPTKSAFPSLHFFSGNMRTRTSSTSARSISIYSSRRRNPNSNSAAGGWVRVVVSALDRSNSSGSSSSSSNYVVPLDASSSITRPLAEILRDLNKRIPDNIIINNTNTTFIPWYHANRMLSFYAPGWCGEVCDVIFSDNGSVTVVYRVTIRGSDGEV